MKGSPKNNYYVLIACAKREPRITVMPAPLCLEMPRALHAILGCPSEARFLRRAVPKDMTADAQKFYTCYRAYFGAWDSGDHPTRNVHAKTALGSMGIALPRTCFGNVVVVSDECMGLSKREADNLYELMDDALQKESEERLRYLMGPSPPPPLCMPTLGAATPPLPRFIDNNF